MRIINEALEDILGRRKDKLDPPRTWRAVISRGVQSFESESKELGEMVFVKFYDRDAFLPKFVAEWFDTVRQDQRDANGGPQVVPIPKPKEAQK